MKYRKLGHSDLNVSRICLGTMTWGMQNSAEDAARQLDMAVEAGVNFVDTAEMYPIAAPDAALGNTEVFFGQWLAKGNRDKVMIATKMAGPGRPIRGGRGLIAAEVEAAVDGSLKRMGVEVIDLYQLHWPQRQVNVFAQRDFQPDLHVSSAGEDIEGMLVALSKQIEKGKIRYIGVSNETPWGIMNYLQAAAGKGLPRIVASQNPYSLMQRNWDVSTGEVAMKEGVDLLAYSPLAGGILSGKYLGGAKPARARFSEPWGAAVMSKHASNKDSAHVEFYAGLARDHGLTPTQLAVAFVNSRAYLGSNIIGATTEAQLAECLSGEDVVLSTEVLNAIEDYHDANPSPSLSRRGPRDAG